MKAIEFFSGIGGFNQAARRCGIETVAAFDQDLAANQVYEINYGLKPSCRNLDSIAAEEIPDADFWWMSPPCAPYTIRGARRDEKDTRAKSLLHLMALIDRRKPKIIAVENVVGFGDSIVLKRLKEEMAYQGYDSSEMLLCPTQFGIPMRRPRLFVYAIREGYGRVVRYPQPVPNANELTRLSDVLMSLPTEILKVDESDIERYGAVLNIIDPFEPGQRAICFTSGYGKCWKASGSLLRMKDGTVRRFAPVEILRLLGFPDDFCLPENLNLTKLLKLIGNSLEVRSVLFVLKAIKDNLLNVID